MSWKKVSIIVGIVLVLAAVVAANLYLRRDTGLSVNAEGVRARDLEAIVSASGKIQPKRQVNISANTTGRVTRAGGRRRPARQDGPVPARNRPAVARRPVAARRSQRRGRAVVAAAVAHLGRAGASVDARPRAAEPEAAAGAVERRADDARSARAGPERRPGARGRPEVARAGHPDAANSRSSRNRPAWRRRKYNLNQVIISSPMDGLVTRRNIEEGETAVHRHDEQRRHGAVDHRRHVGARRRSRSRRDRHPDRQPRPAAKVTIDAVPDRDLQGPRHRDRQQPDPDDDTTTNTGQRQATTFKVMVTLDETVPDVRPGFTCTAEITTATRSRTSSSVPIQALTVREMLFNDEGRARPTSRRRAKRRQRRTDGHRPRMSRRRDTRARKRKACSSFTDGKAVFTPVKIGIAGEQYFEVLRG